MNTTIKTIGLLGVLVSALWSCKKDEDRITVHTGNAPVLTSSTTSPALSKENAEEEAVVLNWNAFDYQWSDTSKATDVLTYIIQIGKSGDQFRNTLITKNTKTNTLSLSVGELNKALLDLGYVAGQEAEIDIRLNAGLAPNQPVYSNVITLTVIPYELASYLYVPGAYQGWDPVTADSLRSATSNGVYIGTINFPEAGSEFKITPEKSWDTAYGDAGDGKISLTAGGNLKSPGAGSYQLTVNTRDNTIQFELVDDVNE